MILEINFIHSNETQRVEIKNSKCIIGRSSKSDYQIDMECFSRSHIEIEWSGKDFYVTDLNSTNGIYINSERIPVATKTLFKNFFPMEIGGAVSISVFSDELSVGAAPELKKTSTASLTSPSAVASKREPRALKKSQPKQSQSKAYFLAPVVIAFAAYYFYQSYKKPTPAEVGASQSHVVSPVVTEPVFNKTDTDLKNLISNDKCSELAELCQSLNLTRPQEKLAITDNEIILYVNYPVALAEMKSPFMEKEPIEKQAEYILAEYAYNPKLQQEAVKRNISHVVIAGIDPFEDIMRIKYSVVLNVKEAPKFTDEEHLSFFSNVFNGGIYRPYRKSLRPYLKVSTY